MSRKLPLNLESLLEASLPELVRQEAKQQWNKRWLGQQIDCYRLEELVGSGTHGVVFRARRTSPYEQVVAIKLLPNLQGQAKLHRFQKECQAHADLVHPNISQILTAGITEDGTPYLVMPLLNGIPIDDYAVRHAGDWPRIADTMRQLANAVALAHQQGVVHCDLKPDNILVDDDGHVTVTDFGLAVRLDELDDLSQRPSWAPGTIGYAAPEILTSRKDASPQVDIYSLGAVLYRLLTGVPPHADTGWLDSLLSMTRDQPAPVQTKNPEAPDALAEICERCLAKEPNHRYASATAVEAGLTQFLEREAARVRRRPYNALRYFALPSAVLAVLAVSVVLLIPFWPRRVVAERELAATVEEPLEPLPEQEIQQIVQRIERQLLKPGVKDPAEPGDFAALFETLKEGASEMDSLLARAPANKLVRHRTATGYFLLGRAAHWMGEGEYARKYLARSERMFRDLHREYPNDGFMFDYFHTIIVQGSSATPREARNLHLLAEAVIKGLRAVDEDNLDYADAHACIQMLLAVDYSQEHNPELFDLDKAESYANDALALAEQTSNNPTSVPLYRKHIMTSSSTLSEIARMRGNDSEALRLAELARVEAIRLDQALQVADTKNHRFDKTLKYLVALRNVGRIDEAAAYLEEADELAQQLRDLDWPNADLCQSMVKEFRASLQVLQESAD